LETSTKAKQETQMWHMNRATVYISWNVPSCCTTVPTCLWKAL